MRCVFSNIRYLQRAKAVGHEQVRAIAEAVAQVFFAQAIRLADQRMADRGCFQV